jgi:hypothetical protein
VHARERVFEPLYYQLFHWALPDMALGTFVVLTVLLLFHMEKHVEYLNIPHMMRQKKKAMKGPVE